MNKIINGDCMKNKIINGIVRSWRGNECKNMKL